MSTLDPEMILFNFLQSRGNDSWAGNAVKFFLSYSALKANYC
jgi:hypothetical protein